MKMPSQHYGQDLRRYYRLPAVQVSLAVVLSLFVISVFIVFALRPTIISITNLQKTISESEKTLKQLDAKVVSLQKASAQLEKIKPLLSSINTSIPNLGAQYSPLANSLEILANQTGVKIENESISGTLLFSRVLSPFSPNRNQKIISMPFSIRVTGTYAGISDFMSKLLKMERIVLAESISITKENGGKTSEQIVALNLSGNVYYLADEDQLNKAMNVKKGQK